MLDPSRLAEICDGDDQIREHLVTMFLDRSRPAIAEMARALAAGDVDTAQQTAHTLQGSSAALGAQRLSSIAGRLSDTAAAGRLTDAFLHQAELEYVYEQTAVALGPTTPLGVRP